MKDTSPFPLSGTNLLAMCGAAALIVIGFILIAGSPSTAEGFNADIFSTRRIVVGPAISFLGFVAMAFAIIWHKKQ